ncbi:hypothetical protein [Paucibacter soli]|uniref:hypothetical protein n=1 Tax=Paucibacter soli TaxID=3133433 RepID=UPI0030A32E6B
MSTSTPPPPPKPDEFPVRLGSLIDDGLEVDVMRTRYKNGRLAIYLVHNNTPWGQISVNVPEANIYPDMFLAKTVDENESLRAPLLGSGLFEDTGVRVEVGFLTLELWRLVAQDAIQAQEETEASEVHPRTLH